MSAGDRAEVGMQFKNGGANNDDLLASGGRAFGLVASHTLGPKLCNTMSGAARISEDEGGFIANIFS